MLGPQQREMEDLIALGVNKYVRSGLGSKLWGKGAQGTLLRAGCTLWQIQYWAEVTHF